MSPDWVVDPDLLPVWQALRRPLETGARTTRLRLTRRSRHALGLLLGRPVTGDVTVVLAVLDEQVRARAGRSLLDVVVEVTGPLRDRAAEQAARVAPLAALEAVDAAWAAGVRSSGLLPRLTVDLAAQAVRVLALLPGPDRLRTELAAAVTGDAHGLDDGRVLASVVLRGLHAGQVPADRRAAWEEAGVLGDTVSTTVLTLGLRPVAGGPLLLAAERGDPVHLTPWDLRRQDVRLAEGPVLVVENPAVLEAFAVEHGGRYPVVCTAGWPATVAVALLERLGVPLHYNGDLDWRGVEICGWLLQQRGVRPWRMTAPDYLAAPGGEPLGGRVAETPWDPALGVAMRKRGTAVHQEQVLAGLLEDWVRAQPPS